MPIKKQRSSSVKTIAWTKDDDGNRDNDKKSFFCSPCITGCVIGMLVGGIILAVLIALLLTSKSSTNTNSTSISTAGATTTMATTTGATTTMGTTTGATTTVATTTGATTTIATTTGATSTSSSVSPGSTTSNICGVPVSVGSNSSIFSRTSSLSSYTCKYYEWTSPTTGTVTLAFQFRNDPSIWYMDDVSVSDGSTEMLTNGGFESGSFSPGWITSTPNGNCTGGSTGAQVISSSVRTGSFCLSDKCNGVADQISQSFVVTTGHAYFISFWAKGSGSSGISISATLS